MGKREIVGFCQKLANLVTNLAQTKANGKPRAKYSSRTRCVLTIFILPTFWRYPLSSVCRFCARQFKFRLQSRVLELKFYKFRLVNLSKSRLVKSYA